MSSLQDGIVSKQGNGLGSVPTWMMTNDFGGWQGWGHGIGRPSTDISMCKRWGPYAHPGP